MHRVTVDHYENFPVASWLCPKPLRAPITAIYGFARTADDLADEGDVPAHARRTLLGAYRQDLHRVASGSPPLERQWAPVFTPLAAQIQQWQLPVALLDDLLDAFIQDIDNPIHPDRDSLLNYCRRSANPIGRLLLHLYGVDDATSLQQSDDICTALQLVNFWQDLSVDHARGRCYLPQTDAQRHGITLTPIPRTPDTIAGQALIRELLDWTEVLMNRGLPLVHRLPGRVGWELRLVVQGGLRVAEKIRAFQSEIWHRRPVIGGFDVPNLVFRAWRMRPPGERP